MRRQSSLSRPEVKPRAGLNLDRVYVATVQASHPGRRMVDVYLDEEAQTVRNVLVKQARRCNASNIHEEMPEPGDKGLIKFAGGNKQIPVWDGWIVTDERTLEGEEGKVRTLAAGVETSIDKEGTLLVRTKVDPVSRKQTGGVTIRIGADDSVVVSVPQGQAIKLGGDEAIVKASYLDSLEARIDAGESAIATAVGAAGPGGPAAAGTLQAAFAASKTAYEAGKASGLTKTLKGG